MAEQPVSYTDTDVELVAEALAAACPTPDQCAPTHDECRRLHGVHWTALGPGGVGPLSITEIEGGPRSIARAALSALSAAGRLLAASGPWQLGWRNARGDIIVLDDPDDARLLAAAGWNGAPMRRALGPWLPVPADTEETDQ